MLFLLGVIFIFFIIVIAMILGIAFYLSYKAALVLSILAFIVIKKKRLFILILLLSVTYTYMFSPSIPDSIDGTVAEVMDYGVIIQDGFYRYLVYVDENTYQLGNHIQASCIEDEWSLTTNFNAFSFEHYMYGKKVYSCLTLYDVVVDDHISIKQKCINYIDEHCDTLVASYTKQLLLGIKDEYASDLYSLTSSLSLIHLFALSGMHLALLEKGLSMLQIKNKYVQLIIMGIYVLLIGNLVSLWRAYLVKVFQRCFHLDELSSLSLAAIILLLYNPYYLYSTSFIFSFTISFFVYASSKLKYSSIYPYISSVPLILYNQYEIPLFGFLYSYLFTDYISILYLLLVLNLLTFSFMERFIKIYIQVFETILELLSDTNLILIFKKPSLVFIFAFYALLLLIIYHKQLHLSIKKESIIIIVMMVVLYCYPYMRPTGEVTMIDVGQGDCIFIRYPYNQGNVLIDTGGSIYRDIATRTIIPYLKSIGVKSLDYIVITHDDYDHSGALDSLVENFEVEEVITEGKDFLDFHWIDIGEQAAMEDDENASSLVYTLEFGGLTYLFTGDLPSELEVYVCELVDHVDVLKVGHHGSSTSTSAYLLQQLSPSIALISVGRNNIYGHPTDEVINRLEAYGLTIYRTDLNGMITIQSWMGKQIIKVAMKD